MKTPETTVSFDEIEKFSHYSQWWWDTEGPLKTLHDINEVRLDFIQQHSSLANLEVLDVGCGGGILCEAMAKSGAKVTGIDAEQEAITVAKEHAKSSELNINYCCTPIEGYQNQSFDVVTCMEMLEHVRNPDLVIKHCKQLLKPNGVLVLSTINRTVKAYAAAIIVAEYVLHLIPKQTHDYTKFIKPSELLAIARSFGFKLLDMKGMDYNPFSRNASLGTDVTVNYLLALRR